MAPPFEFHISRRARDRYHFDETLLGTNGRLIVSTGGRRTAGISAARRIVERVYGSTGRLLPASDIFAAALIEEIMHLVIRRHESNYPGRLHDALLSLELALGLRLESTLEKFTVEFPPSSVYAGRETVTGYLSGSSQGIPHRQIALEEMLLLHIANRNPALEAYKDFFDDRVLNATAYRQSVAMLIEFFSNRTSLPAAMGHTADTLIDLLMAPLKASPHSLEGQLQYLLKRWGPVLALEVRQLIVGAMDLMREEAVRAAVQPTFAPSAPVPDYSGEPEDERYSSDLAWMPRVVLLAKNSYVWLEQLSRKYKRWIRTLDEIPDEELDILAARGFTALWMIGLWERSPASQRIKQRMGNADAVASAYAVRAYDIALDLGGWSALRNLADRASRRGIRLSADMVPNHMGINSWWVIEHPDWFLSIDGPPFPSYSFNSENVSDDPRIAMVLEDHYYDQSDAAVVFERRDMQTGDRRYVYHGNDGTGLPWNDTAQLDYTDAEVREAVIQTILHVARNFPIIRFDSAMTSGEEALSAPVVPPAGKGRCNRNSCRARHDLEAVQRGHAQ